MAVKKRVAVAVMNGIAFKGAEFDRLRGETIADTVHKVVDRLENRASWLPVDRDDDPGFVLEYRSVRGGPNPIPDVVLRDWIQEQPIGTSLVMVGFSHGAYDLVTSIVPRLNVDRYRWTALLTVDGESVTRWIDKLLHGPPEPLTVTAPIDYVRNLYAQRTRWQFGGLRLRPMAADTIHHELEVRGRHRTLDTSPVTETEIENVILQALATQGYVARGLKR